MPSVALCMIVKNEMEFLADCLRPLAPRSEQVVIVDTGSTDGTADLARRYATTLLERPFDEDFSAARNLALDKVGTDWVMFIDADERLGAAEYERLRALLPTLGPEVGGVRLLRYSFLRTGGFFAGNELKVFRARHGIRYRRRVLETVVPSLEEAGLREVGAPVILNHFGHCRPRTVRDAKLRHYLRMIDRQLEESGPDPVLDGYASLMLRSLGRFREALARSDRSVVLGAERAQVWMIRGDVLRCLGRDDDSLAAYDAGLRLAPWSAQLWNMRGVVALETGDNDAAVEAFRRALSLQPRLPHVHINLGLAEQSRGGWERAADHFRLAGRLNPAFFTERWKGRIERDPYRPLYNHTIYGYAGLGYHLAYCTMRARGELPEAS
jgi:glycosyltransferase involved in cell wall biosynthesis